MKSINKIYDRTGEILLYDVYKISNEQLYPFDKILTLGKPVLAIGMQIFI